MRSHPDVMDAIVVGAPDERFGQRVAAIVEPRPGHSAPSLEDVQEHCRNHVAGYKVPRQLHVVDKIERSPSGKPDYRWANAIVTSQPDAHADRRSRTRRHARRPRRPRRRGPSGGAHHGAAARRRGRHVELPRARRGRHDAGVGSPTRRASPAAARAAGSPVVHCTAGFRADRRGRPANAPLIAALLRRPEHLLEGTAAVELVPGARRAGHATSSRTGATACPRSPAPRSTPRCAPSGSPRWWRRGCRSTSASSGWPSKRSTWATGWWSRPTPCAASPPATPRDVLRQHPARCRHAGDDRRGGRPRESADLEQRRRERRWRESGGRSRNVDYRRRTSASRRRLRVAPTSCGASGPPPRVPTPGGPRVTQQRRPDQASAPTRTRLRQRRSSPPH